MGKKKLFAASAFLLFIQSAAAQSQGIIPLFAEILGLPLGNIYTSIGTAAVIGEMIILIYIPMKIGARKLGIERDVLGSGTNGGRNIAIILSTLIVLSLLGVSAQFETGLGTFISLYGALSIVVVLGVAVLGLAVALSFIGSGGRGMLSITSGGGKQLQAQGKAMQAEGQSRYNEAKDLYDEVRRAEDEESEASSYLDRARQLINNDEEEEAAELIEDALGALEEVIRKSQGGLEDDREEVEDAIRNLKDALEIESGEIESETNAKNRIIRASTWLNAIEPEASNAMYSYGGRLDDNDEHDAIMEGQPGPYGDYNYNAITGNTLDKDLPGSMGTTQGLERTGGTSGNFYSLNSVDEDIIKARKKLEAITEEIDTEETEEKKYMNELLQATHNLKEIHDLMTKMKELLQEAEQEDESLEKIAKNRNWKSLFDKADQELDEEESIEQGREKIEEEEEEIINLLERAEQLLNKHMKEDDTLVNDLEDELEGADKMRDTVETIGSQFANRSDGGDEDALDMLTKIENQIQGLEHNLDDLRDESALQGKQHRKTLNSINNYIQSYRS